MKKNGLEAANPVCKSKLKLTLFLKSDWLIKMLSQCKHDVTLRT